MGLLSLGFFEDKDEKDETKKRAGETLLRRVQKALTAAGHAEYAEAPPRKMDHEWKMPVEAGVLENFQIWMRRMQPRLLIGADLSTLHHVAEADFQASVVYLPDNFQDPVLVPGLSIGSSRQLELACVAAAPLLGIPDLGGIAYDFSGSGENMKKLIDGLNERLRGSPQENAARFACTALYQGAALSIARNRGLLAESQDRKVEGSEN